jgi:hypothetical protein
VWQGYRYLHFPELNEVALSLSPHLNHPDTMSDDRGVFKCCMCCTAANGCGIVKRDWLVNGTYQGTAVVNNTKCDTWYVVPPA